MFTIFEGELRLYQQVAKQLGLNEYPPREDYEGEDIENPDLRRLVQILTQKSQIDNSHLYDNIPDTRAKITSVLQRNMNEVHVRDSLLQIANMCQNFSLFDVISDQASIELYLSNTTPTIIQLLNSCFVETKSTRSIRRLEWPVGARKTLTFFQADCVVTQDDCEREVENLGPQKKQNTYVSVSKFNLSWLYQDGQDYLNLVRILNESQNNTIIFDTEFVDNLLSEFWEKYWTKLFYQMFLPFVGYMLSAITFMYVSLFRSAYVYDDAWYTKAWVVWTLGIVTFVFWIQECYLEFIQLMGHVGKRNKLKCDMNFFLSIDIFNLNDKCQLTALLILLVTNLINVSLLGLGNVSILSAFVTFSLILKFYEWLRIFEKPAFYIRLIAETIKDVRAFFILFVAALMMFGAPLIMLNFYRWQDKPVYDSLQSGWLIDSLFT